MSNPSPTMHRSMFVPYPSKPAVPTTLPPSNPMSSPIGGGARYQGIGGGATSATTTPIYSPYSPNSAQRMVKVVNEISSSSLTGSFGGNVAVTVRDSRERERKDLSNLNDRLASYIEKVRFLEAQNRKLETDLDLLRGKRGKDSTSIQNMYDLEIKEAKKLVDETDRQQQALEKEIQGLKNEVDKYKHLYKDALLQKAEKFDDLLDKLCKIEADISFLKRKITAAEEEVARLRKEKQGLIDDLQKARQDLDQETLNRIDFQNQVQTLLEEIDFMKRVNDSEIKDLQLMASRDTTIENREYFKNELSAAMRDIRQEYDQRMQVNRTDMESWYRMKVQEISTSSARVNVEQGYAKEEVKRLRNFVSEIRGKVADLENRNSLLERQIKEHSDEHKDNKKSLTQIQEENKGQVEQLQGEIDHLIEEKNRVMAKKTTLDAEIAKYRLMLEEEEKRSNQHQIEQLRRSNQNQSAKAAHQEESVSRSSYQRSAKGNVSIQEAAADGTCIILENTHRSKEEDISGWKLKRKIDAKKEIVFTFPQKFVLKPLKTVKILGKNQGAANGIDVLVHQGDESFGVGHNVETILHNAAGEERATLIYRAHLN
ncbi:unnamed protein product, partial [Mesorhabditis belari]|uniref:Uncharacterized protein n=1 Tax=Mesorhabditis belari TaxID=2138241 RepID=A0AAF3FMB2_9BILA